MIKTIAQRTTCPRIAGGAKTTRDALRPARRRGDARGLRLSSAAGCARRGSAPRTTRLRIQAAGRSASPSSRRRANARLSLEAKTRSLEWLTALMPPPPPPLGVERYGCHTDPFCFRGAYCWRFVPLLRTLRGTARRRHAYASARDLWCASRQRRARRATRAPRASSASARVRTTHRTTHGRAEPDLHHPGGGHDPRIALT